MADKTALGMIGLMLCGATLLVMTVGGIVVGDHLTGRLQLDSGIQVSAIVAPAMH